MIKLRYTIPNSFTALSLLLGVGSIVTGQLGDLELAGWMIVWCGLLDVLDGVAARLLKATSDFGAEFDSMADLVAFGVAPSMLNNRSTSVTISSVIESSPAQSAGLQPGDEIVRYDGERVFSMTDLTRQTMDGTAGQNVVVDIMRDGTPMQIVMPRGPVGISGGRRSR